MKKFYVGDEVVVTEWSAYKQYDGMTVPQPGDVGTVIYVYDFQTACPVDVAFEHLGDITFPFYLDELDHTEDGR